MSFWQNVPTIGDLIANSLASYPNDWAVERVYMGQILTNHRENWRIHTMVSWAGDSLHVTDIPLTGREERRIWRAIHKLNERRRENKRAEAVRQYYCNAASAIEARRVETPQEVPSQSDESAVAKQSPKTHQGTTHEARTND